MFSKRLLIVVPIALALIFLLLFSTFGSLWLAALVYLAVPMAATGAVLALEEDDRGLVGPRRCGQLAWPGHQHETGHRAAVVADVLLQDREAVGCRGPRRAGLAL